MHLIILHVSPSQIVATMRGPDSIPPPSSAYNYALAVRLHHWTLSLRILPFQLLGQGVTVSPITWKKNAGFCLGPTAVLDEIVKYASANMCGKATKATASDRIFIQDPSLISPLVTIQQVKPTMLIFTGVASVFDYEYILRQTMYRSTLIEFDDLVNKDVQLCISDVSSRQCSVTTISLLPVNDNLPVFQQSEYTFDVAESAVIGQVIGAVSATDNDTIFAPSTLLYCCSSTCGKKCP